VRVLYLHAPTEAGLRDHNIVGISPSSRGQSAGEDGPFEGHLLGIESETGRTKVRL
jgi:hypothetical protein